MAVIVEDSPRRQPCKHSRRYRNAEGYPVIAVGPRGRRVRHYEHRYVYAQAHGPIPEGMQVDHLCHGWDETCAGGRACMHRRCIEITHLEAVPPKTNALRGRGPSAQNARKTHCKRGHEFTPENTYYRPDRKNGTRQCKECMRAWQPLIRGLTLAADDRRHGTLNGYNSYGCRCERCRAALREYRSSGRVRVVA